MKRLDLVMLFWWFFLWSHHNPVIGPFASLEQCQAIQKQIIAKATRSGQMTGCWSDGRK